jgi:TolA-binding protein
MSSNDFPLHALRCSVPSRSVNAFTKPALVLLTLAVAGFFAVAQDAPREAGAPDDTNTTVSSGNTKSTNDVETQALRNFLILQDQLRATQRAVEQTREQVQADARRSEELLAARLNLIEQTFNARRVQEVESLQESTRVVTIMAFAVTGVGLLAVLFAGFVQVKAMTRLAEVSRQLHTALPPLQLANASAPALSPSSPPNMR